MIRHTSILACSWTSGSVWYSWARSKLLRAESEARARNVNKSDNTACHLTHSPKFSLQSHRATENAKLLRRASTSVVNELPSFCAIRETDHNRPRSIAVQSRAKLKLGGEVRDGNGHGHGRGSYHCHSCSIRPQFNQNSRGVRAWRHLPFGTAAAPGEGAGSNSCVRAGRSHGTHFAAAGGAGSSPAGHHHARQRDAEGQCRDLSSRD